MPTISRLVVALLFAAGIGAPVHACQSVDTARAIWTLRPAPAGEEVILRVDGYEVAMDREGWQRHQKRLEGFDRTGELLIVCESPILVLKVTPLDGSSFPFRQVALLPGHYNEATEEREGYLVGTLDPALSPIEVHLLSPRSTFSIPVFLPRRASPP